MNVRSSLRSLTNISGAPVKIIEPHIYDKAAQIAKFNFHTDRKQNPKIFFRKLTEQKKYAKCLLNF